jgi:hypothetical protein
MNWKMVSRKLSFILIVVALTLGVARQSQAQSGIGTCAGILHMDQLGIHLGGDSGEEGEDSICFIRKSEENKVLSVCAALKYCKVSGVIDFGCKAGECEIKKVTSVRRR